MFKSVKSEAFYEVEISKSKFLGYIKPILNINEAVDFIKRLRAEHKTANHVCFSYIADIQGNVVKFSDDNEPSGTAGMPILECLKANDLRCIVLVIVRYFGGIKLGAGGLTRAYFNCASETIKSAKICNYFKSIKTKIECAYESFKILEKLITKFDAIIEKSEYHKEITIFIYIKEDDIKNFNLSLNEIFNKKIALPIIENLYKQFD